MARRKWKEHVVDLRAFALDTTRPAGQGGVCVSMLERMADKFTVDDGCWLWTSSLTPFGYGRIQAGVGVTFLAHRVMYALFVGPIPSGYQIDHLCKVRNCVNPGHLEAVTPHENVMRSSGVAAANVLKTHCPQGHLYDEANTDLKSSSVSIKRRCRTCNRDKSREYQRARRKELHG